MLRVAQGNETTLKIGSRVPILNASFAPIFNSSALSKVIQNNSFQAAFPSFNYEDVGLTLKAKPTVNRNNDVGLQLEMQFRTILGQSFNGVPVIANREYKGSITLRDYQPAVVAGTISRTEQRSMNGIPGLGAVPGLNQVMVQNSKELDEDELLVVITPRVVSNSEAKNTEVWMAR
jgi:type II secretory pathway component GspD/PulD (secretin)